MATESPKEKIFNFFLMFFSTILWKESHELNVWPVSRYFNVTVWSRWGEQLSYNKLVKNVYKYQFLFCPEQLSHQIILSFAFSAMSIIAFIKAVVTSEADLPEIDSCHKTNLTCFGYFFLLCSPNLAKVSSNSPSRFVKIVDRMKRQFPDRMVSGWINSPSRPHRKGNAYHHINI